MFFEFPKRSRFMQKVSSFDNGHFSVQEKKTNGMERTTTNLKESGILLPMSWSTISKTAGIWSLELSVRWIGDSSKAKVDDVQFTSSRNLRMQSSYFAQFIQQISFSKAAQYLRSSGELVWRTDPADTWSIAPQNGELRREGERSVISKVGTARSGQVGDTKYECSSSGWPTAYSSSKIWRIVKWDENNSSLRICGIHEGGVTIGQYFRTVHCNQVWMRNGGRILWNAAAICETFKISCLLGRHLMRGGSEYHFMFRLFRLEGW